METSDFRGNGRESVSRGGDACRCGKEREREGGIERRKRGGSCAFVVRL